MEKKRIYKAVLYSRVSTVHDEQAESIDNQILLAKNYLSKHPDIVLAEPLEKYSERISGKTDNRPKFQELCERLSRGDIHYLLVKDLKRLSRSVETTYAFFNLMKQFDFEIIQLSSGNIIDSRAFEEVESNLLLGIEALFAQNTVLTQSRYGKTVQKVRCANKKLAYKDSTLFGYEWNHDQNDIIIVDEKADVIRELFNRYVFRNQGIRELRTYLASKGYNYSDVTVSKWLQESKYIGDWTINRKGSTLGIGQGAKSHRFNRDRSEWVHIERPDLAIVDKDVFDLAQEIRLSRIHRYRGEEGREKVVGRFTGKHLFAAKIYCAECGSSYRFKWADRKRTVATYQDSFRSRVRDASQKCPNTLFHRVYEEDIKETVIVAINALNIKGRVSISKLIEAISLAVQSREKQDRRIESEKARLKKMEKEAGKISDAFVDATSAMRIRLNDQLDEIERKINECKDKIFKLENLSTDEEALQERLTEIENQLAGWIDVTQESLNRTMVEKLIARILIHMDGRVDISLKIGNLNSFQLIRPRSGKEKRKEIDNMILPSGQVMDENIRQVFRDIETEGKENAVIKLVSFQRETSNKSEKTVTVCIDTKQSKNESH